MLVQYLQDVLPSFAKKLIIHLNIKELQTDLIRKLSAVLQANKGENQVTFEVLELETIKKQPHVSGGITPKIIETEDKRDEVLFDFGLSEEEVVFTDELSEDEEPLVVETISEPEPLAEETKIITRLSMPSRKLKIKISNELLTELKKMDVDFRLN
jgi:DNA polymerase-3 subunit alpha